MNDPSSSSQPADISPVVQGPQADPEVVERATRRRFSADYKARIVEEAATCQKAGEVGALLRREGLYSSHLAAWRKQLERHGLDGLKARKRGRATKPKMSTLESELKRKARQLEKRLAKAEAIIAFQKKCTSCWGSP